MPVCERFSRLAQHGAEVVFNGRDGAKLDAAVRELADTGAWVSASDFDVTDADAVKPGVDTIAAFESAGNRSRSMNVQLSF